MAESNAEPSLLLKGILGSQRAWAGPPISQVMVNGPDDVYVERKGRIKRAG